MVFCSCLATVADAAKSACTIPHLGATVKDGPGRAARPVYTIADGASAQGQTGAASSAYYADRDE